MIQDKQAKEGRKEENIEPDQIRREGATQWGSKGGNQVPSNLVVVATWSIAPNGVRGTRDGGVDGGEALGAALGA
jgi:hypothetical protein